MSPSLIGSPSSMWCRFRVEAVRSHPAWPRRSPPDRAGDPTAPAAPCGWSATGTDRGESIVRRRVRISVNRSEAPGRSPGGRRIIRDARSLEVVARFVGPDRPPRGGRAARARQGRSEL